ncbi:MAG: primosomal protein N' [bacterium]
MKKSPRPVQICIPLPLHQPLTYLWPESLPLGPSIGRRVLVPLGKRRVAGYVVQTTVDGSLRRPAGSRAVSLREVLEVLDEEPLFGTKELELYRWIARYYLASLGEVLRTALPLSMHLRTYRALRLLPPGIWALERGAFLTPQEAEILEAIRRSGKMAVKDLAKRVGRLSEQGIASLERKGFVDVCQLSRGSHGGSEKTGRMAWAVPETGGADAEPRVAPEELLSLLSSEESEIRLHLLEGGPCSRRRLEKRFPRCPELLPGLIEKGFIQTGGRGLEPWRKQAVLCREARPVLSAQQEEALSEILDRQSRSGFCSFLLHGATASGKTEVYLRVIEHALKAGKDALLLVPEIGLTPQTLARLASRFGPDLAVLHSRLSPGERLEFWWKIRRGQLRIAIGARSAVFAPFQRLGVIVVDEEHDPSYKQQDRVRYNARDLALVRGKQEKAIVILGSATPSLESYYNAGRGKSILIEMPERIEKRPEPEVSLVDLKDPSVRESRTGSVSIPLQQAILDTLEAGKKCLLFLNRRGYSNSLICRACGHLFRCPRCEVTLTYHLSNKSLCCHYCEYQRPAPDECPGCRSKDIRPIGLGTERIEEEIRRICPQASIGRMDRDTTRRKGAQEKILGRFRQDGTDILIGTQMIAKGHDIPAVTLVGVILADVALDLPDFRASERTFQLLVQVAGRAGRGPWPGKVLVQTRHPEHFCMQSVRNQDYRSFFGQEILFRKAAGYPPFCRMVHFRILGRDEAATRETAMHAGRLARSLLADEPDSYGGVEILGPSQAPLPKLRGRFRFHFFARSGSTERLHSLSREIIERLRPTLSAHKIDLEVDVDPLQVL